MITNPGIHGTQTYKVTDFGLDLSRSCRWYKAVYSPNIRVKKTIQHKFCFVVGYPIEIQISYLFNKNKFWC